MWFSEVGTRAKITTTFLGDMHMRQGRTLQELASEIQRQKFSKRDFLAPAALLKVRSGDSAEKAGDLNLDIQTGPGVYAPFRPTETFHDQLAEYLKIPRDYYRRMAAEAPELLAESANTWLGRKDSKDKRLVRTLDGTARAFLSDTFRPLDNFDLADTVLPILVKNDFKVESCEVTDKRMYLKVVTPR